MVKKVQTRPLGYAISPMKLLTSECGYKAMFKLLGS